MATIQKGTKYRNYYVNFLNAKNSQYLSAICKSLFNVKPDISNFADTILPVLFGYLDMALREIEGHTEAKELPSLDRIFYALETYSENLEEKLVSKDFVHESIK